MLKYYFYRVIEKVYKHMHMVQILPTSQGIKGVNAAVVDSSPNVLQMNFEVSTGDLYLGADFLLDEYSLVNCPIIDSPHCDFVRRISEGIDLEKSEYIKRLYSGTLDWRYPMKRFNNFGYFISRFTKSKTEIIQDKYDPIMVYKIDGKYYIFDGKHRAALCAMLGYEKVRCTVISPSIETTGLRAYMTSCMKGKAYSKHFAFVDLIKKELQS